MSNNDNIKMNLEGFPVAIQLDGFNHYIERKSVNGVIVYTGIACFIITVLALITLFVGPSSVTVSSPIKLSELWLIYSGGIASVFAVITLFLSSVAKERWPHINYFFDRHVDMVLNEKPLSFGDYHVELIDDLIVVGKDIDEVNDYIDGLIASVEQEELEQTA